MPHHHANLPALDQTYILTLAGDLPVDLPTMKSCLKVTTTADDDFITALLEASTSYVEKILHGRQIRVNKYDLLLDEFPERIPLNKDPVKTVEEITRLVGEIPTAVDPATYYLKRLQQGSEILLQPDQAWPTDQDIGIEHAITVTFKTTEHACTVIAMSAIKRHVTYMYENRGDCDPEDAEDGFKKSGAAGLLAPMSIKLV